jgi:hypothetical protein
MKFSTKSLAWLALLALGTSLYGCPRDQMIEADTAVDIPAQTLPMAPEPATENAPPPMERRAVVTSVSIVLLDEKMGEDGEGNTVEAVSPVAIDITAQAWPVRALDPVLHVGGLGFHHYTFPRMNVLRYVVADGSILPDDTEVWIQYGGDESSRVKVADRLEVP